MSLNVYWRISEQKCMFVSLDTWMPPAWHNGPVFPEVYYVYILDGLVLAYTVGYVHRSLFVIVNVQLQLP